METPSPKTRSLAALLAIACLLAFAQVFVNGFVAYDDDLYVYANPQVLAGLSADGVRWAFTTQHAANWHPLTWLSHMLDAELYDAAPAGHHATSLVLHVLATWVLLATLVRAGLALGASAFVAGVFALHPTRVESVAWIAERKDVLCALFWFLALYAWVGWSRRRSVGWYALALACQALALLAKPMAVTLPLTLLLFDLWPLGRARERGYVALVVEKLPFFALVGLASFMTLAAQQSGGAVSGLDVIPLAGRVSNAFASFAIYLGRFAWPFDLAVLYPLPHGGREPFEIVVGVAAFSACALVAWYFRARRPAITIGLSWFALTLVPVIGLVQVGLQANADRYTYVPYVGLALAVVGALEGAVAPSAPSAPRERGARRAQLVHVAWTLVCVAWVGLCFVQTATWRDSATLFRRALAVTEDNFVAHLNYGLALLQMGGTPEAIAEFEASVRIRPDYYLAHSALASAYFEAGRFADAERTYRAWLAAHGDDAAMLANLATVEMQLGEFSSARRTAERARELDTERRTAALARCIDLALLAGDYAGAAQALETELAASPGDPALALRLAGARKLALDPACVDSECSTLRADLAALEREVAGALATLERGVAALAHARHATELAPADADAHADLGVHAVRADDLATAQLAFERAVELAPARAELHNNLGFVRYRRGELESARDAFREALRLAPGYGEARKNLDAVEQELARR
ncbi:MAG: tetratricopeptide repeat protein [Planctomycetes bacterium]|nr:tetratricopeptide repeat protein [Planctomycetota bacterium]